MRVKLVLNIDIDTDETKSAIEDRLGCCDYDSFIRDEVNYALDEFGEVKDIEMDSIEAFD
jgi:hypothetical protein